jgi:hypothetical protein
MTQPAADLFTTAPVTRSRAPADVEAELEEQLRRLFRDPRIPKRSRILAEGFFEAAFPEPSEEELRHFIGWLSDIRRRHEQLTAALQHAG